MQPMDVGIVHVARAAARLEQKEGVGIQRGDLEIIGILCRHLLHGVGIGAILLDPLGRVERLDVAHRHRVDERALLGRGAALQRQRFLRRGIRVRRFLGVHRRIEVRPPRPRFAPVTDRAVGIALPRFAERPHGLRLGEGVHHLKALIEERLRLLVARGHRLGKGAETSLENLNRLGVTVVDRAWLRRLGGRRQCEADAADGKDGSAKMMTRRHGRPQNIVRRGFTP